MLTGQALMGLSSEYDHGNKTFATWSGGAVEPPPPESYASNEPLTRVQALISAVLTQRSAPVVAYVGTARTEKAYSNVSLSGLPW